MQGTVSMRLPMRMTLPVPCALPSKDGKAQGTGTVILIGNLIETVPCIARHLTSRVRSSAHCTARDLINAKETGIIYGEQVLN